MVGTGSDAPWTDEFASMNDWGLPERWGTLQFPDVNGDGAEDVCTRHEYYIYCARSNKASGFESASPWSEAFGDSEGFAEVQFWSTLQFPDIDADGNSDICMRSSTGIQCATSTKSDLGAALLERRAGVDDRDRKGRLAPAFLEHSLHQVQCLTRYVMPAKAGIQ
jgi:hypothetical protein